MTESTGSYTEVAWCPTHGYVGSERELCPECSAILLTKGEYRASDRHGSFPREGKDVEPSVWCFDSDCNRHFKSVREMVPVPGKGDRDIRHYCPECAERLFWGMPLHDEETAIGDPFDVNSEGYPRGALEAVVHESQRQFSQRVPEHGPGKNWLEDEPRVHVFKACDEVIQARDHAQDGETSRAVVHFANALNHMLFASEITQRTTGEDDV